jgi:hypothetical protein
MRLLAKDEGAQILVTVVRQIHDNAFAENVENESLAFNLLFTCDA